MFIFRKHGDLFARIRCGKSVSEKGMSRRLGPVPVAKFHNTSTDIDFNLL
jgi:hypothetical protein